MKARIAILAAALVLGGITAPAHAADSKAFTTMHCFAANPTQQTDLVRSSAGIRNNAAASRLVFCPLVRDEEDSISTATTIVPFYRIGPVEATVTCTAYHGSSSGAGGFTSTTASVTGPANGRGPLLLSLESTPDGFYQVQIFLVCSLGPGTTLSHIYMNETGITDLPPTM